MRGFINPAVLALVTLLPVCAVEARAPNPAVTHGVPRAEDRVDINHASVEELMKVPGMTHSWAERIVRFRPYRSKADLEERGVLPSQVYDRIKDFVIAHREKK